MFNCNYSDELRLDENIKKIWEIENFFEPKRGMTAQETDVEKFSNTTTVRDETGRFVVRLPFIEEKLLSQDICWKKEYKAGQIKLWLTK